MSIDTNYIDQRVWAPDHLDPDSTAVDVLKTLGIEMNWAQRELLTMAEQLGDDGKRLCRELFVTGERQSGKSAGVDLVMLWAIVATHPRRIMYTGPDALTVDSTFRRLVNRVEALRVPSVIRKNSKARGAQEIEATNGTRIIFRSRGGRGVRGVEADTVIFDGAEDLDEQDALSGLASLLTSPDPQRFFVGVDLDRGFVGTRPRWSRTKVDGFEQAREIGLDRVGEVSMGQLDTELARRARRMFAGLTP